MDKQYIKQWIIIAIKDLKASEVLFEKKLYSNAFYHFQQASEKGLKASAFLNEIYNTDKDAYKTGHYTLEVFKNFTDEQKEKVKKLKEFDFDFFTKNADFIKYEENLNATSIPLKNETFQYSLSFLQGFLETINGLKKLNFNFPADFEIKYFEQADLLITSLKKINEVAALELKSYFNSVRNNPEETQKLLLYTQEMLNFQLRANFHGTVIYLSNLISHNHNQLSRYPGLKFNPLKYYTLRRPIIKTLPQFNKHLFETLKSLKKSVITIDG